MEPFVSVRGRRVEDSGRRVEDNNRPQAANRGPRPFGVLQGGQLWRQFVTSMTFKYIDYIIISFYL